MRKQPPLPFQIYDCRGIKLTVIAAYDAYEALKLAKERGIFAPMVNINPITMVNINPIRN